MCAAIYLVIKAMCETCMVQLKTHQLNVSRAIHALVSPMFAATKSSFGPPVSQQVGSKLYGS